MKTKLLIIIWIVLPLLGFSQVKPEDFKWQYHYEIRHKYRISYLPNSMPNTFYFLMDNYIKITSIDEGKKPEKVEFENGLVKKISDSTYCVIPKKLGQFDLIIDGKTLTHNVEKIPTDKLEIKFNASTSPFPDCINKDEFIKSEIISVSYNKGEIPVNRKCITFVGKEPYTVYSCVDDGNKISKTIKDYIIKNITPTSIIYISDLKIYLYDTLVELPDIEFNVVDNYENEFVRRAFEYSPFFKDLDYLKTNVRIKMAGYPSKEDILSVQEIAGELNQLLPSINIKIVDYQPNLIMFFDTLFTDI